MSDQVPDEVIELVLHLPKVDNPRVYDDILDHRVAAPRRAVRET